MSASHSRFAFGVIAVVAGAALVAFGVRGEQRLHARRSDEAAAVRIERERLRDEWVAASETAVRDVIDRARDIDLAASLDQASAAWKRGVETAATREGREFEAYIDERRWTLLALFTGVVSSLVGGTVLVLEWLRRRPTALAASGPPAR